MNLYRSFGNLLETWVTEGDRGASGEEGMGTGEGRRGPEDGASSGRMHPSEPDARMPLLWSESEDSGLEMASSQTSLPSPSFGGRSGHRASSVRDEDAGSWSSPPLSPVVPPSSSSLSLSLGLSRAQAHLGLRHSAAAHLKLEQALQRVNSARGRGVEKDPERPGDPVPGRQCRGASLPRQLAGGQIHRTGQRSVVISGPRREVNTGVGLVLQQASERHRQALSLYLDTLPVQAQREGEEAGPGLSPGLGYLEHVCRMLEEIAKQQIHNRGLQVEMDTLCEQQAEQGSQTTTESESQCADESKYEEQPPANPRFEANDLEDVSSHMPLPNDVFRRRTSSDTQVLGAHLRKLNMASKGQCLSADDLLEHSEDEENIKEVGYRKRKTLRARRGS